MADHEELLRRFQPALRYDSNEQYFADSAAQYAEHPGNELRRVPSGARRGELIASAVPAAKEPKLTLAFLGPKSYANGVKVEKTDVISVPDGDPRSQYVRLRAQRPELRNRIYGRAAEVDGRLWLQYWLWYFHSDHQLALSGGTHEGGWEVVQLRIGEDTPDLAVYGRHGDGEQRPWAEVGKLDADPDTPVVYVARGSHASYFEPGLHQVGPWNDIADGRRPAPQPALEIVGDDEHAWLLWPGRWGNSVPRDRSSDLDQPSPAGPGSTRAWRNPTTLLSSAGASTRREMPRAPDVEISRMRGKLQLAYDFSARRMRPRALVVTVNSRNEQGVPPWTHTFEIEGRPSATLKTAVALDPSRHYDIYSSTVTGDPPVASASQLIELAAVGKEQDVPAAAVFAQPSSGGFMGRLRGAR